MYYARHPSRIREERWLDAWPKFLLHLIAFIQLFFTWMIIGLECWNAVLDIRYAFAFVGFFTSISFNVTWLSTMSMVFCHRYSRTCANVTLIVNLLSIVAASVLIYFDAKFIQNPLTCFAWVDDCQSSVDDSLVYYDEKLLLIRIQLSFASVLLVSCLLFVIIYLIAMIKFRCDPRVFPSVPVVELDDGPFP